ncbi:MAG: ankyrin repeat domain-containing protein [Prosthecobacter sp.]|jgi:hypothetical protein|uniref:ankyrin repeat domain-containing protein n=1 Tax=Prosthecobacter sp. TaxID=1965333 RepID=UPI0019F99C94|nr:ankyrin repeat domain-containing protein [Prosthecobacter sp.]MBE2286590.1 ankyrin repeat domain-containing protein [Prosthecobacter sp.]
MNPGLALALSALLVLFHPGAARAQMPAFWNQGAKDVPWEWDERAASPFAFVNRISPKYHVRLLSKQEKLRHHLHISFFEGEREVFTFKGHTCTVFSIWEDRLYYALFSPASDGATIVAVDLTTGKEAWRSDVLGIGLQQHSRYSNALNLQADPFSVRIYGNEAGGQYYEVKRADTGVTTAHKIFSRDETDPSAIAVREAVEEYHGECRRGYLPAVKRLIEAGLDVNARYSGRSAWQRQRSALHCAAEKGAPAVIDYLLDQGHVIDPADSNQKTPLVVAAELAQKAREAEAKSNKPRVLSETGLTELQGALKSCHILLQRGAALSESWRVALRDVAKAASDHDLIKLIEQTPAPKEGLPPKTAKP